MFGRRKPSLEDLKTIRPTPDDDGVTRVLSKALWDDPTVGNFLRQIGMEPDAPRNRVTTAEEHIARFARAREALMARTAAFNRELAAQYGHCNARPMLIIAPEIWDGVHGAFLYGQLDLCGYDEWNVLMCADDRETIDRCGIGGHPGSIRALTQTMTEKIVELEARYQHAHDALGMRVLGKPGISASELDDIVAQLRSELVACAAACRTKTMEILSRCAP